MKDWISFTTLLLIALILIIGGFTGAMGKLLASILVPSQVILNPDPGVF